MNSMFYTGRPGRGASVGSVQTCWNNLSEEGSDGGLYRRSFCPLSVAVVCAISQLIQGVVVLSDNDVNTFFK